MKIEVDIKINGFHKSHMESGTFIDLATQLKWLAKEIEEKKINKGD